MEHITLFFCDIMNTFLGKQENNEDDIKIFIENLKKLKEKNNSKYLLFTFASAENIEEIEKLENYLSTFIDNSSVRLMKNSSEEGLKIFKIICIIKNICKNYFIDEVYYADDCKMYHILFEELLPHHDIDIKCNSIITNDGGMKELNEIIENKLKDEKSLVLTTNNK